MTVEEVLKVMSTECGLTMKQCKNQYQSRAKHWQEFMSRHPELVIDARGNQGQIAVTEAGEGIEEMIEMGWSTIKRIQDKIDECLSGKLSTEKLNGLVRAQRDAQQAYMQLSEIKSRQEDREQAVIKRENVEAIIEEVFPMIKQAVDDQMSTIKQILPPEMRAAFDQAYQESIDSYTPAINEAVDKLNALL